MFNFKKITLLKFTILGIIFTVITGTLLHFVYDLSNGNPVVGLFAPINESVWEHLKLLFYPATLWITIGYKKFGKNNCNYLFPAFLGVVSGLITIPVLFYLYTFILKKDILVLDILIYSRYPNESVKFFYISNTMLFCMNMIPSVPLDGGILLKKIITSALYQIKK